MKTLDDLMPVAGDLDMATYSDGAIIDAWDLGDGLDLFYRRYAGRVRRYCQTRLNHAADAEDACHETILRAYAARSSFRPGAPIWPWLSVIAKNVCIDLQRSQNKAIPTENVEVAYEDLESSVAVRARSEIVHLALADLPRTYSVHLYLRDFRGWSYDDIAKFLDTSVAAVRSTLMRARQALKKAIVRQSSERGMWPLPVLAPVFTKAKKYLFEFRARLDSAPSLDRAIAGLCNVAVAAVISFGNAQTADASSSYVSSASRPTPIEVHRMTTTSIAPVADITRKREPGAVRPESSAVVPGTTSSTDLDGDGGEDTGFGVGPVGVTCSPEPDHAIGAAVCQVLRTLEP